MSSLLYALGKFAYRRWPLVLACWFAALAVCGAGAGLLGNGPKDLYRIPSLESFAAIDRLSQTFPEVSGANGQILVLAEDGKVSSPENRARIAQAIEEYEKVPHVDTVLSPWDELVDGSVSKDQSAAIIQLQMDGTVDELTPETQQELIDVADELTGDGLTFHSGGGTYGPVPPKPGISEVIGLIVAFFVLAFTFRSLVSAGLPLLTALVGVGVGIAVVWLITAWVTIASTGPLLALMIGLAVGIDYALFVLARHRDQLAAGLDPEESTGRALATAGSAVVFAGVTVIIALLGLAVTGVPFLTLMGVCGAIAVAAGVVAALTLVPALFGLLKHRVAPKPAKPRRSGKPRTPRRSIGELWVAMVTRFAVPTVVIATGGLLLLAAPAVDLRLALPDNGTAREGLSQRETYDLISEEFGIGYNGPLIVTADIVQSLDPVKLVADIKRDIAAVDGVDLIAIATPNPDADTMAIQVIPETGPTSVETAELLERLRGMRGHFKEKYDVDIQVTGMTAAANDISTQLTKAMLPFGALVMGMSLILLAMVFRSILVPIKATLGYLLSVGASFGAVVLVYQDGLFEHQLHTVSVGPVICFLPILLMGVLFGLAMDYEVFLVSRMREYFVHGASAQDAVRQGFVSSVKVVTAAALIMIAVFAAFVPHGDAIVQPIAFGLAVGVFIDAFVVRMTIVPAVMHLLGNAAWWLPASLDRRLPAFDVEGEGVHRQLELADWPTPDAHPGIHAEGVVIDDDVLPRVDVDVAPGELLVVAGGSARARTALSLALTAHMRTSSGRLKVAGFVLPEESLLARSSVSLIRLSDEDDPVAAIRATDPERRVLVIDDLGAISSTYTREEVLVAARDLAIETETAVVLTTSYDALSTVAHLHQAIPIRDLTTGLAVGLEPTPEGTFA